MAKITAIVEVNFSELGKLFLFVLPQIFLFTIPLSFFIGLCLSLFRLSRENETIVLFSLGFRPKKLAIFFGIVSFIVTVCLLINSLVLIPISNQLNTNFLDYKKREARLNLKPSESGQRFSNWMLFVKGSSDINGTRVYKDIVLYQAPDKKQNQRLVLSNSASIKNINNDLSLFLKKGYSYDIGAKSFHETEYSDMTIRTKSDNKLRPVNSIFDYWSEIKTDTKRAKNFSLYVLISILPLCTFLFALSFGIVTYRYQKNEIYGSIFAVIFVYFVLTVIFSKYLPIGGIFIILGLFSAISFEFFRQKILRVY